MKTTILPLFIFVSGAFIFPPICGVMAGEYWLLLNALFMGITVWIWRKIESRQGRPSL